jgi:hypothetical protein
MKKEVSTLAELDAFLSTLNDKRYVIDIEQLSDNGAYIVQWQEHKTYISHTGEEFPEEIWTTEAGDMLQVQDIPVEHCRNILRMILRNERETRHMMETVKNHLIDIADDSTGNITSHTLH